MISYFKKTLLKYSIIFFCLSFLAGFCFKLFVIPKFVVNVTSSIPMGIYYRFGDNKSIAKNELVEFFPKGSLKSFVIENGYLREDMSFLKIVSGVAGDCYEVKDNNFYINDTYIGPVFQYDSKGHKLPQISTGKHTVSQGFVLLTTPSVRSFDSRYYGEIPISIIKNKIHPVFNY